MELTNIDPERRVDPICPRPAAAALRPDRAPHLHAVFAFLDRLARIARRARLTGALWLTVLCIGLTVGASIDTGPPVVCVGTASSTTASMDMPAPSSALERAVSGPSESIQVSDAQDDPAPSLDLATDPPGRRQRFHAVAAIAYTSALPSRNERPPIRSFLLPS